VEHNTTNVTRVIVPTIRLELMGGTRLYLGQSIITKFSVGKSLSLLAFLALNPGVNHPRDFLADLLWPGDITGTPRARLSVALTYLRKLLSEVSSSEDVLVCDNRTILLVTGRIFTDVAAFEKDLRTAESEAAQPAKMRRLLRSALRQYGGDFLPGYTDQWIEGERGRLLARYDEALILWSTLTHRPPPRPRSPLTLAAPDYKAPDLDRNRKTPLPLRAKPRFVGRDQTVQRLKDLSHGESGAQLITLTGPGGVGKTRLALEAAAGETDRSVVWVPLADLPYGSDLTSAFSNSLGLPSTSSNHGAAFEAIVFALNAIPTLVLLDNAEHLQDTVADFVTKLLQAAPNVRLWVTSRKYLDIEGERVFPIGPLSLPPEIPNSPVEVEKSSAGELFIDRAQMFRPDFTVTAGNAPTIARLCQLLDGMPLALELAAAQIQTISIGRILETLQKEGTYRLANTKKANVPARHVSLEATISWSVRLLPPSVKQFFYGMSVFHGGWTAEAAEAITGDLLTTDHLAELVSDSLVVLEERPNGTMRYRLLETIRDFATHALGKEEYDRLRYLHCDYFTTFAERLSDIYFGGGKPQDFEKASAEEENYLFALRTAQDSGTEHYLRLAGAAARLIERQREMAITHLQQALSAAPVADSVERARALFALRQCHAINGMESLCIEEYREAVAMARRLGDRRALGRYLLFDTENPAAQEEAERILKTEGLAAEQSQLRVQKAIGAWRRGFPDLAEQGFLEALRYYQSQKLSAYSIPIEFAYFLMWRGELRRALPLLNSAIDDLLPWGLDSHSRWIRASVSVGLGDYAAARSDAENVIASRRILQPSFSTVTPRRVAALACIGLGDTEAAKILLDEARNHLMRFDPISGPAHIGVAYTERYLALGDLRGAIETASEAFDQLYVQAGRPDFSNATFWETITAVNTRAILARTELALGLIDSAAEGFISTLAFRHRFGLYYGALNEVEGLAVVALQEGDRFRAVRLYTAADTLRLRSGLVRFSHQTQALAPIANSLRVESDLAEAQRDGKQLTLVQAIEDALTPQL
jgi:predicted ATPase